MAKKRKSSGRTKKTKSAKPAKPAKRARRTSRSKKLVISSKRKLKVVLRNLIMFFVLSLISFLLYRYVLNNDMMQNLFYFLAIIFGFVSAAFLIVLVMLLVLRLLKK